MRAKKRENEQKNESTGKKEQEKRENEQKENESGRVIYKTHDVLTHLQVNEVLTY